MKEFIEKLIGRLEEVAIETLGINKGQFAMDKEEYLSYCSLSLYDVKEQVNQLAEEQNNGWIEELLEAKKNCGEDSDCSECPFGQIEDRCILAELQIDADIKKNNGWIPCTVVDHPEHCNDCEVTFKDVRGYGRDIAFYTDKWRRASDEVPILVVAWKEPSAPYQPKGE